MMSLDKHFKKDFDYILKLLQNGEPFAFNRFSDGELFILQNKDLVLDDNLVQVGDNITTGIYSKEDFKDFKPERDAFFRDKLVESFKYKAHNYFKGLSCRCCVGEDDFQWQLDFLGTDKNESFLTWANLLVNGNYKRFIEEMYPLFNNYKTVFICNEKAKLSAFPFVVKDFRVGYNAMIRDYGLIDEIKQWVQNNDITGHLFLFSASSFSKMAIHQLYEFAPNNIYIDVGTTLNAWMSMKLDRSYLSSYWLGKKGNDVDRVCIW